MPLAIFAITPLPFRCRFIIFADAAARGRQDAFISSPLFFSLR